MGKQAVVVTHYGGKTQLHRTYLVEHNMHQLSDYWLYFFMACDKICRCTLSGVLMLLGIVTLLGVVVLSEWRDANFGILLYNHIKQLEFSSCYL